MTQRRLNSTYNDKIGRDGRVPKNISTENVPIKPGMRSRIAPHSAISGSPFDDEPLQKTYEGKSVPINPGTPSRAQRGQHIVGEASAILHEASRLGKPAITDPANGQTYDGGSRPVTSQD
jgi:hypothetical protein